ncbi:MAG: cobyric acid synthase [Rhodospirillales bacterium]
MTRTSAVTTPSIMIQGTGSDVGKSLLVAGLARAFVKRGLKVAPFKPQNMSNNAAVTADGGEIGRAQALQARAAGLALSHHMNPVLLKPQTDIGAQVVVQGKVFGNAKARDYQALKPTLLKAVLESFAKVSEGADLVLVEGAGSPAEINLREGDIANMGFAEAADLPVVLCADIDRGGVIAQVVGTQAVIAEADRARIKAFVINKFRGDVSLFDDGLAAIVEKTGWPSLGVVPWFAGARALPAEDAVSIPLYGTAGNEKTIRVAVPAWPRLSNFDDLDPLRAEPNVAVDFVEPGRALPACDLIVLAGSKATRADLEALKREGWDIDIQAHVRRGGWVIGLCGGYQMLGHAVHDPQGLEGEAGSTEGLGLLDVETRLGGAKHLTEDAGRDGVFGEPVRGYHMHMGVTEGAGLGLPFLKLASGPDGARAGRVMGGYLHGLFAADGFRRALLETLRPGAASDQAFEVGVEAALDGLADHLERHMDLDGLLTIAKGEK